MDEKCSEHACSLNSTTISVVYIIPPTVSCFHEENSPTLSAI